MIGADEKFLSRVEGVRQTGPNRWIFKVPTRDDKHPSGSARLLDDGRLLIHDHGGDSALAMLEAVGLEFKDLYPEPLMHHGKPERRPFPAADVLRATGHESLVVASAVAALRAGKPLSTVDMDRVILAAERLQSAMAVAGVTR